MIVDQAISSLSNFLLVLLVGRKLGPAALGSFSLVVAAWLVVYGVVRALVVDPMLVQGEDSTRAGAYINAALLIAFAAGTAFAVGGLAIGLDTETGRTVLVLAIMVPVLVLQEMWRRIGFLREQARASALNDLVFLVVQSAVLAVFVVSGHFSAPVAMGCWGIGAAAAAALGGFQFDVRPMPLRTGARMLVRSRGLSSWLALDFLFNRWGRQAALYVIAGVTGTESVGAIQASASLMGPANILNFGASAAALADGGNRARREGDAAMRRVVYINSAMLALVVGTYALVYAVFAESILGAVYGTRYLEHSAVGPLVAVATLIYSVDTVPMVRLRLMRQTRILFVTRLALTPVGLLATWLLANAYGVDGAVVAYAVVALALTGGAWLALAQALWLRPSESAAV